MSTSIDQYLNQFSPLAIIIKNKVVAKPTRIIIGAIETSREAIPAFGDLLYNPTTTRIQLKLVFNEEPSRNLNKVSYEVNNLYSIDEDLPHLHIRIKHLTLILGDIYIKTCLPSDNSLTIEGTIMNDKTDIDELMRLRAKGAKIDS